LKIDRIITAPSPLENVDLGGFLPLLKCPLYHGIEGFPLTIKEGF
jgi:hypothetical protein